METFTRVTRLRVAGVDVVLVGVAHAADDSSRTVVQLIRSSQPSATLIEGTPERIGVVNPETSDDDVKSPYGNNRCFPGLLATMFALTNASASAASAQACSTSRQDRPYGGESTDALREAVAAHSKVTLMDRHITISLARCKSAFTWLDMYNSLPSLVGCVYLPGGSPLRPSHAASLLYSVARRDWQGVSEHLRDISLTASEQEPMFAASPVGRASSIWNQLILRRIRDGPPVSGPGGGGDPALGAALTRLLRAQQQHEASASREAAIGYVPPGTGSQADAGGLGWSASPQSRASQNAIRTAFLDERDELMAHAIFEAAVATAATAAGGGGSDARGHPVVAVMGSAHVPGVSRWLQTRTHELPLPAARVTELTSPPPWHSVTSVGIPAAAALGATALAVRATSQFRRRPLLAATVMATCVGVAVAAREVTGGVSDLHRRIGGL